MTARAWWMIVWIAAVWTNFGPAAEAQSVLHVNQAARPGGNGQSWATAFDTLQGALTAAQSNPNVGEIWVAAGTYQDTAPFSPRDNLGVYGGFAGLETARNQRDFRANVTTLDGQSQHGVVTYASNVSANAILDGFTLTSGAAADGGGIYTYGGSPTLRNLLILGNTATDDGGGIYAYSGSPTLSDVVLKGNKATAARDGDGGGMYCYEGSPTLTRVHFEGNSATGRGGAYANYSGKPTFDRCTFVQNTAIDGGAVRDYEGQVTATHCVFQGNQASGSGGGFYTYDGTPVFTNDLIAGNTAGSNGGGSYGHAGIGAWVNCTFAGNRASTGGGLYEGTSALTTLTSAVVWGNQATTGPQISGTPTVNYSCVQGGWAGIGNTAVDPQFKNAPLGDYRPGVGSSCIDAGDSAAVPATLTEDLAYNTRKLDDPNTPDTGHGPAPIVDMGAYEYTIDFPGTREDLVLQTSVGALSPLRPGSVKAVQGGSVVNLQMLSPTGLFAGEVSLFGFQVFATSQPPRSVPGLPGLWITPGVGAWIIYAVLPIQGLGLSLQVPKGTPVGLSFLVQSGVASSRAQNKVYAATDGVEFRVQP
jgi:predicted outer membrane repeat protein